MSEGLEGVARPDDAALWRSVSATIRDVLLPGLGDDWARAAAVQLVGLAEYARTRPPDPTPDRMRELADTLDFLAANPLVAPNWPDRSEDPDVVLPAVSAALAAAVGNDDETAVAIRESLRPLVLRHLDDDLMITAGLLPYFRGALPDDAADA